MHFYRIFKKIQKSVCTFIEFFGKKLYLFPDFLKKSINMYTFFSNLFYEKIRNKYEFLSDILKTSIICYFFFLTDFLNFFLIFFTVRSKYRDVMIASRQRDIVEVVVGTTRVRRADVVGSHLRAGRVYLIDSHRKRLVTYQFRALHATRHRDLELMLDEPKMLTMSPFLRMSRQHLRIPCRWWQSQMCHILLRRQRCLIFLR